MVCRKCGKDFSEKVYEIHIQICKGIDQLKEINKLKKTISEMDRKELYVLAKAKGISNYSKMKTEDLKKVLV